MLSFVKQVRDYKHSFQEITQGKKAGEKTWISPVLIKYRQWKPD